MTAEAARTTTAAPVARRRRFARWRPGVALGSVVGALIGSQLVAVAFILAAGGDDAPDWLRAAGIVLADLVLLGVVVRVAQRGAPHLKPATLGVRRTRFWPAVGWMFVTYFAVMFFNVFWILLVGTGATPRDAGSDDPLSIGAVVLVALGIAVVAPIVEEITFRG